MIRVKIWEELWAKSEYAMPFMKKSQQRMVMDGIQEMVDEVGPENKPSVYVARKALNQGFDRVASDELKFPKKRSSCIHLRIKVIDLLEWWVTRDAAFDIEVSVNILLYDQIFRCPVNLDDYWPRDWKERKRLKAKDKWTEEERAKMEKLQFLADVTNWEGWRAPNVL